MTGASRRVWRLAPLMLPAAGFDRLAEEARAEGHRFLDRMRHEWSSGANRFDRPGERLLAAYDSETLVAVGGLNIDPYAQDPSVGRLRHIYVLNGWRRQGLASELVAALLARPLRFKVVRLRAAGHDSAALYEALAFTTIVAADATHKLEISRSAPPTSPTKGLRERQGSRSR